MPHQTKPNHLTKPNQDKPNQTKINQTKPTNQTKLNIYFIKYVCIVLQRPLVKTRCRRLGKYFTEEKIDVAEFIKRGVSAKRVLW